MAATNRVYVRYGTTTLRTVGLLDSSDLAGMINRESVRGISRGNVPWSIFYNSSLIKRNDADIFGRVVAWNSQLVRELWEDMHRDYLNGQSRVSDVIIGPDSNENLQGLHESYVRYDYSNFVSELDAHQISNLPHRCLTSKKYPLTCYNPTCDARAKLPRNAMN